MSDWEDRLFGSRKPPPPNETHANGTPSAGATRYALAALESECLVVAASPEGMRNDALNRAAYRMGRHIGAGSIDPGTVREALAQAGRASGLPPEEVNLVLRDDSTAGMKLGQASPRTPAPLTSVPDPTVLEVAASELGADDLASMIRERYPVLDWHQLWADESEEEWIVEPLLPARRLVALFSAPKVGKSLLMLEVAVAVAQGSYVLGVTPDRPRRVLYVDFENDPRGDIRERLQAMGRKPSDLDNLCYLSYPSLAKLDTFAGAHDLMTIVAEYQCEVVVIDTISRAVGGEENDNDTWLAFYRNTGLALKQAGVTCIRLDHTGKDHEKGMRGGSAKYGDVDVVWKLSEVTDDTFQLDCTDHRLPIAERTIVVRRKTLPTLHHEVQAEGRMAAWDAQVTAIVQALDAVGAPDDIGRPGAREALEGTGVKARNATISKAVRERKRRLGITTMEDD